MFVELFFDIARLQSWRLSDLVIAEKGDHKLLVARYVGDILICSLGREHVPLVKELLVGSCPELAFTVELPVNGEIQFLDLHISLNGDLCWQYGKPSLKCLVPSYSCHPKAVKGGLLFTLGKHSFKKSCMH